MSSALRPISDVARDLGLLESEVEPRGRHVAKVSLGAGERTRDAEHGALILVTAMTPTARGEGKTTTAIGLVDGLRRIGASAVATLRQSTLGPVFGAKGAGTGGGRCQLVPRASVDLHLTGDSHAVQAAHNLAAAVIDSHLHHGDATGLDPWSIDFPRVIDLSDRALRRVVVGLGGRENGPVRESAFEITSASEVMAILALAETRRDLRARLGRIVIGARRDGTPVRLEELGVAGAMAALLNDAIEPNLVQTLEGSPALVHAGPFANIAHGCSSVIADRIALGLSDYVVTEAGFGADLGAEKFFDVKCRASGLRASAAVLVATVKTLEAHGADNLAAHVAIVKGFGVPCIVAVNAAHDDADGALEHACASARASGASRAVVARPFDGGGAGCEELARAVVEACERRAGPRLLYEDALTLEEKLETVARKIYGADGIELAPTARRKLEDLERLGFGALPVCIAKTHLSLSHDPTRAGCPRGFLLPVRSIRLAAGAGFVTAMTGDLTLMPGLPSRSRLASIDVNDAGEISGLD